MKRYFSMLLYWWIINILSQAQAEMRDDETFSQVDLESDKENIICAREKKPLDCTAGSTIAVNSAFWGRLSAGICPSEDGDLNIHCYGANETLGIVRSKCDGLESCELEARHDLLQTRGIKHCPGVNKYLIVRYTCEPKAKEVVLCDSENSTISCPDSYRLFINSVFWGRQSTRVCPSPHGQTMCMGTTDSLGVVRSSCQGKKECPLYASYGQVQKEGESCPGVMKYLIVNYSCKNADSHSFNANQETDITNLPLDFIRRILAQNREEVKSKVMREALKKKLGLDKIKTEKPQESAASQNDGDTKAKSGDRIISIEISSPLKKKMVKQNKNSSFHQAEPEAGQKKKEINPMIIDSKEEETGEIIGESKNISLQDSEGDAKLNAVKLSDNTETENDSSKSGDTINELSDSMNLEPEVKEYKAGEIKVGDDTAEQSSISKSDENVEQKNSNRQSVDMETKDYNIDLQDLPANIVAGILKILAKKRNGVSDIDSGGIVKDGDTVIDKQDIEIDDRKNNVATPLARVIGNKKPEEMDLEELRATTLNELKKSLLPKPYKEVVRSHGVLRKKSKIEHPKKYKYYGHGYAGRGNMP